MIYSYVGESICYHIQFDTGNLLLTFNFRSVVINKMSVTEFHLSKTEFNEPRISKDAEAIAVLIVRLILLEPGTFQSHPDMGVGLLSRYRYRIENDDDDIVSSFIADLNYQIDNFLPIAKGVRIRGTFEDKVLSIFIAINNALYRVVYDEKDTRNIITLQELVEEDRGV